MKLKGRLKLITDSIPPCGLLVDIGTDHAYIPIYSTLLGICKRALAADLRPGPLKRAQENIKKYGQEDLIETRLSDGLESIEVEECEVIVIAGMGGPLIRRILSDSISKAQIATRLLLQPNNAADALRRWLYENGFEICRERLVEDSSKLYCLIEAHWTGERTTKEDYYCYIGEKVLSDNEPLLLERYLVKKLNELNTIISGRAKSDADKIQRIEEETSMDTAVCIEIRDRLVTFIKEKVREENN